MKVLVVDDFDSTRALLRRILVRDYSCAIVEAETGLDALTAIASHQFSFVLLDVAMPIMNGIETLEAIRRSSEQPDLPVVIVTGARDEPAVRRIVALGVMDYLTKPLKAEQISQRLGRVVAAVSRRKNRCAQAGSVQLTASSLVMVAEGDPDFRHFFEGILAPYCAVSTADSGAHALKRALETPPQVLFFGSALGVLNRDLLAQKARELLRDTSLVAVVAKSELDAVRQSALFDAVLARSFVPEVFTGQLRRMFHESGTMTRVLSLHPNLRINLISAVEQVFGMMLSTEASVLPVSLEPTAGEGIVAEVELTLDAEHLSMQFKLSCGDDDARALGAALTGTPPADVAPADRQSACQEMANMITGRLQAHFRERGITVSCSLPRVAVGSLPAPLADVHNGITVDVESAAGTRFRMSLEGHSAEEPTPHAQTAAMGSAA